MCFFFTCYVFLSLLLKFNFLAVVDCVLKCFMNEFVMFRTVIFLIFHQIADDFCFCRLIYLSCFPFFAVNHVIKRISCLFVYFLLIFISYDALILEKIKSQFKWSQIDGWWEKTQEVTNFIFPIFKLIFLPRDE